VTFVETKSGKLACGDVGKGALADVETIVKTVTALLK
jgi:phosphopantothenoylcysteine synthetase/decarboxylase